MSSTNLQLIVQTSDDILNITVKLKFRGVLFGKQTTITL